MKRMKKAALCLSLVTAIFFLTACQGASEPNLLQFSELEKGEEIAVMTVKDYGEIKFRFFPQEAPKAVENFTTHVKNGYYDGLTFHRVMQDFMIQGGDPDGNGGGGESIWGEGFAVETSNNLYHFRGALCMAKTSQPNSIGSQFYILQNDDIEKTRMMLEYASIDYADKVIEKYQEVGGYPGLDGNYTVFGQVIEGLDVLDAIAASPVVYNAGGERSAPYKSIVIEKIVMTTY